MVSSQWIIYDTGAAGAKENMDIDAKLLNHLDASSKNPILHLYDWKSPSATYGHFINPADHLSEEALNGLSLHLAKRPTGGGLIFHTADWAFSILVPAAHEAYSANVLDNYAFVNRLVIEIINRFLNRPVSLNLLPNEGKCLDRHSKHFCMAKPTKYDVMLNGKKVGGGAQRRTKSGFLHQGSISLGLPDDAFLSKMLRPNTKIQQSMLENTYALLEAKVSFKELVEARQHLSSLFKTKLAS